MVLQMIYSVQLSTLQLKISNIAYSVYAELHRNETSYFCFKKELNAYTVVTRKMGKTLKIIRQDLI